MSDDPGGRDLNWPPLLMCCLAGAVLVAAAFVFQSHWLWSGATIEALIEAGIALAFVGLAFLFEKRFVKGIAQAATDVAKETFADRTRDIETRLDQLTDAVRDRLQEAGREQDEIVSQLDYPSYDHVMRAMEEADNLQALGNGSVRVSASALRERVTLTFQRVDINQIAYGASPGGNSRRFHLEIIIRPLRRARIKTSTFPVVEWLPDQSADEVGFHVAVEIQKNGYLFQESEFDWALALGNLKKSIDLALRSQRRDSDAWLLNGKLYELLSDDWAVTTAGLEHRPEPGFILRRQHFYRSVAPSSDRTPKEQVLRSLIGGSMRPDWCSLDDWRWLVVRAQEYY